MLDHLVMFLTGEWAIAGEVQEGGRLANPLTAADPPPRNSLRRGFRPDEGTAGLPDIDPVRRHDLKLIDDFISRVAH